MMEDFSGLALPPLFGGHILEAELEPGGVELSPGEVELDAGGNEPLESTAQENEERRALDKRKYLALSRRCKEIEQINQKILGRLHQVQRITRRLKKERRFLMKTLDSHGDDYRNAQLTILLEKALQTALKRIVYKHSSSLDAAAFKNIVFQEESGTHLDPAAGLEDEKPNGVSGPSAALHQGGGPKKKRHRFPRQERDKDQQIEPDMSVLAETQFGEMPSPTSLSH